MTQIIRIVSLKELVKRYASPSMKRITVHHEDDAKKLKRPVAWLVVGRREKSQVGNLLVVGRNARKTVSSYSTPRCLPSYL